MKRKAKKKPVVSKTKTRQSLDRKLAALAPHEQIHQLLYGRPNNGDALEMSLREVARCRRLHEFRTHPIMTEPGGGSVEINGELADPQRTLADANAEHLATELRDLTAQCGAALKFWQPETFERIAALMRKINAEPDPANAYDPAKRCFGMDFKAYVRAVILSQSKLGPVNQWQLACHLENTSPNPNKQSDSDFRRTDATRKTIGNICKTLKVRSKVGRHRVEK